MLIIFNLVKLHYSSNLLCFFLAQNGVKFLIKYSLNILYRSVKSQLLLKRYISSDRNRFSPLPSFMAVKFKPQYRSLPPFQREWLGGILKSLQSPNKPSCLLF